MCCMATLLDFFMSLAGWEGNRNRAGNPAVPPGSSACTKLPSQRPAPSCPICKLEGTTSAVLAVQTVVELVFPIALANAAFAVPAAGLAVEQGQRGENSEAALAAQLLPWLNRWAVLVLSTPIVGQNDSLTEHESRLNLV
jgi:hypothetical protein